jgi:hypothetical protein
MRKYVDYKYTSWGRMYFKEDADMSKIIDKLEQGYLPIELGYEKELKFDRFEHLDDVEEYITPSENNGSPTIEVFIDNHIGYPQNIWDNVNKHKV